MRPNSKPMQRPASQCARLALLVAVWTAAMIEAVLVQPHNYMLDDSPLTSQHDSAGSLSPFYNDQTGSNEQTADKDIVSIIGDSLARLRWARMLDHQQDEQAAGGQLSQEMADLIQEGQQQQQSKPEAGGEQQSLSSSVASMLMNVAQAAAASATGNDERHEQHQQDSRGPIMELDTSQQGAGAGSAPSKSDLKATSQWYNPKETIPVLKISSMGKLIGGGGRVGELSAAGRARALELEQSRAERSDWDIDFGPRSGSSSARARVRVC
jgi:hypothetical protein